MKKRVSKIIRKNIFSVLTVMIILMATILTACGSSEATEPSTEAETTKVETAKEEVAEPVEAEIEEISMPAPTEEPTPEPTPTPTPDTTSTLPGVEWIQTFDGIVDEPKLIVFNDETNQKIILEEFEEVEFYDADTLALYIPKGQGKFTGSVLFENIEYYDNIVTFKNMPSAIMRDGYSSATGIDIEFDGNPKTLYCYLKLMG